MRVQPRQQILETWRALARSSYVDHAWVWGGRQGRNSISDAEQLLCLMAPATKVGAFKLDLPDETADDVLAALAGMGDSVELPRRLLRIISDYLRSYTTDDGNPVFSGGSYFGSTDPVRQPTEAQRQLEVVDSFSTAVQLSLAIIGFVRVFRTVITREDLRQEVVEVESMASTRLTAALIGLLRSFAIHVFDVNSPAGETLCHTINQDNRPQRRLVEDLQRSLRRIHAGLRDLTFGIGDTVDLDNPNQLFECGWSWGVRNDAPEVETTEQIQQPTGVAQPAPYLYFTVVALDGIQDLFTERTRLLGLLNEEQHRLARALQIRWDLTQSYWSTIASFGNSRWPLEDIPWRTTDELESDYFTLLVSSIMVQALADRPANETDLHRVGDVLDDLASRARITRRPFTADIAIALHTPGVSIPLEGSEIEDGPRLSWLLSDFSPQLLKRTIRVAGLLRSPEARGPLLELADSIWDHLLLRRHRNGPASQLWDEPAQLYGEVKPATQDPSWYYTERVVESLIAAATLVASPPLRSPHATTLAADLLTEAEHLFDQELLMASADAGAALANVLQTTRTTLRRARELLSDRPGTALVLVNEVLRELDRVSAARLTTAELV